VTKITNTTKAAHAQARVLNPPDLEPSVTSRTFPKYPAEENPRIRK
jgi:hypothetical protein